MHYFVMQRSVEFSVSSEEEEEEEQSAYQQLVASVAGSSAKGHVIEDGKTSTCNMKIKTGLHFC